MKQITIDKITFSFPENWNEITLKQFIRFMDWLNNRPVKFEYKYEEWEYNIDLIRVFSMDDIDGKLYEKVKLDKLTPIIQDLDGYVRSTPKFTKKDHLIVDGVLYGFIDMDEIGAGEYISITKYQEIKPGYDSLPYILAVICRPARKEFNVEKKKDVYILEEFNSNDIEWRAEKMLAIPAFEVMGVANFFLSGNNQLIKSLLGSTKPKRKATQA